MNCNNKAQARSSGIYCKANLLTLLLTFSPEKETPKPSLLHDVMWMSALCSTDESMPLGPRCEACLSCDHCVVKALGIRSPGVSSTHSVYIGLKRL